MDEQDLKEIQESLLKSLVIYYQNKDLTGLTGILKNIREVYEETLKETHKQQQINTEKFIRSVIILEREIKAFKEQYVYNPEEFFDPNEKEIRNVIIAFKNLYDK